MGPIIAAPLIRGVMVFEPIEESNCNRTDADIDVAAAAIRALAGCDDHDGGDGTESDDSTNSGTDADEESEMEGGSSDESDGSEEDSDG